MCILWMKLMASSGCEWKKLGDVCEINNGKQLDKKNMVDGIYKVYGGGKNIVGYHNSFNRESDHIIIAATGNYSGFVNYSNKPFWASQCFTIKSFNNIIDNKYLYYLCKYVYQTKFMNRQKGGAQSYIRINDFKDMNIPIPPQETQTQVVQTLDDLANLRQNYMDIRDGLERRMKYYFEMMIKRHLGEITMEKLGDVCEIEYGDRITKKQEHNPSGLYYVYGGGNYSNCFKVDKFNRDGKTCKISRFAASLHNCVLLLNGKYFLNDSGMTISSKNIMINNDYLAYYIHYRINNNSNIFSTLYRGADQQNIDLSQFKDIDIPKIELEIQAQIVQYLDNLEAEKNKITEILQQLDTEMREILTQSYQ
jgi:type I restriction enzyme S subunit